MISKKAARSKRPSPSGVCDYTKTFLKDWERLARSCRYELKRLKESMLLLIANDAPLDPEWVDHPRRGGLG
jgi:mRNA interferase YafQ